MVEKYGPLLTEGKKQIDMIQAVKIMMNGGYTKIHFCSTFFQPASMQSCSWPIALIFKENKSLIMLGKVKEGTDSLSQVTMT